MKIRLEGAEFFHAGRQTGRQTSRSLVAFRKFANAPKNAKVPVQSQQTNKLEMNKLESSAIKSMPTKIIGITASSWTFNIKMTCSIEASIPIYR
jgi:hypothetical protein